MRSLPILLITMMAALHSPWDAFAGLGLGVTPNAPIDTELPAITRLGDASVTVECNGIYSDAGATAFDICSAATLTANIVTTNPVNTNASGIYTVRYNVADTVGNIAIEETRTVVVKDMSPPEITLLGATSETISCNCIWPDLGATALDLCDGDLTGEIIVTGTVDTSTPGVYTLRYDVADAAGNAADEMTRTVMVQDILPPEITLLGGSSVTIGCGVAWPNLGATALDLCDGNLTGALTTAGVVDTATPGQYTLTYDVVDAAGNTATPQTRLVTVLDNCALEGEGEGAVSDVHSADTSGDHKIQLPELLRVVQFFNMTGYACDTSGSTADGYTPGPGADYTCHRHASDYDTTVWKVSLQELLRLIQFFNMGGYHACPGEGTDDGYCPGVAR